MSSTQIASSVSVSSTRGEDDDDAGNERHTQGEESFLSSLQSRISQVESSSNALPLMILDAILPRQVLQIQIHHPTLKALMRRRAFEEERPTIGMLGMARLSNGRTAPLRAGVEVTIVQMDKAPSHDDTGTYSVRASSSEYDDEEEPWDITLRAGRRLVIEGDLDKRDEGWMEARVKFTSSSEQEEDEVSSPKSGEMGGEDRLSVARAISKSRQFTEPNANFDGTSLVDRWIELARENERHPGQIDTLLEQLGDIPPEHEPTERALWVGALINPLPSMGVATEVRPALLVSRKADERVLIALDGIIRTWTEARGCGRGMEKEGFRIVDVLLWNELK